MKKYVFGAIAVATLIACDMPKQGGNHGVIKKEDGVERYDDATEKSSGETHGNASVEANTVNKSDVAIDLNGIKLKGYKGGMEDQMVNFLKAGSYKNATDDATLKDKWYSFDKVNFKIASSNQLETGSELQLENLAQILKAYPDAKIKIGGYTDKTGNEAENVKLSQARAEFIKTQLSAKGVGAQVLSAEGYGSKFATVDVKATNEERAVDRKMAVRFSK